MVLRWTILIVLFSLGWEESWAAARSENAGKRGVSYQSDIKPLLTKYCYTCHGEKKKGDLDLRIYADEAAAKHDRAEFEKVLHNLQANEMPPENKPQPTAAERKLMAEWIEAEVLGCDCNHPDPGRVTIRRLNRTEYNNTIRDLVGIPFQPADDFPDDDVGYGFDNIGDVLSLSPMLMEKYLAAAEKVLDLAVRTGPVTNGPLKRFEAAEMKCTSAVEKQEDGSRLLATVGEVYTQFRFPKAGEYVLRVRAAGQQAGPEPVRLEFRLDQHQVQVAEVKALEDQPETYEVRLQVSPGEQRVAVAFINDYYDAKFPDPDKRDRNAIIHYLEIAGPLEQEPLPESHRRIFFREPTPETTNAVAREIIASFARRAYRRPVTAQELDRLAGFVQLAGRDGGNFQTGIKLALEAVLVSPNFLFRGELQPEPDNPKSVHAVDEYALASRLSYFLWSSLPDEELFALARQGKLQANLEKQVKRMLKDPKAHALVENFADQWLQIRNLANITRDPETFPTFNEDLRAAMSRETELFFEFIMQQDRSIFEFIDADYTFLNERLARHYGLADVKGDEFRRVNLKEHQRGGLLAQASILTVTSTSTRTSPVKRGKWVLDNLLAAPPPPPPPDIPALKEGKEARHAGTLRQQMEQHRADPSCAACHARMDPIGFGLENYDAIGAWRTKEGDFQVDPSGQLAGGESFQGAADLKRILLKEKQEAFVRCLSEKMLTYALGRGLEYYDKCALDEISRQVARNRYRFSSVVLGVVRSTPFQRRRGEAGTKGEQASLSPSVLGNNPASREK
jgi:cytochrome c553